MVDAMHDPQQRGGSARAGRRAGRPQGALLHWGEGTLADLLPSMGEEGSGLEHLGLRVNVGEGRAGRLWPRGREGVCGGKYTLLDKRGACRVDLFCTARESMLLGLLHEIGDVRTGCWAQKGEARGLCGKVRNGGGSASQSCCGTTHRCVLQEMGAAVCCCFGVFYGRFLRGSGHWRGLCCRLWCRDGAAIFAGCACHQHATLAA